MQKKYRNHVYYAFLDDFCIFQDYFAISFRLFSFILQHNFTIK